MSQAGVYSSGGPTPPASPPGYGQVYNQAAQDVLPGATWTFDSNGPLLNISHVAGSDSITINSAGTYMVTWLTDGTGDFQQAQFLVNGVPVPQASFSFGIDGALPEAVGNAIVNFSAGDVVQLKNTGTVDVFLDAAAPYSNASITFEKIPAGGASSGLNTLVGNVGSATQVAGIINLLTANSTVEFSGAGNTMTQDFGLTNLILGSNPAITIGQQNVGLGNFALSSLTAGIGNVAVGFDAMPLLTSGSANTAVGNSAAAGMTTGDHNTAIGNDAMQLVSSGANNVAVGSAALEAITTATNNTAIGTDALTLVTGSNNIALGNNAGASATTNGSCIYIGHTGVATENNVIRIGTDGAGAGQQNTTVIAGDVASVRSFTAIAGNITAQLGDVVITAGNLDLPLANSAGTHGYVTYTGTGAGNRFIHGFGTQNFFAGYQAGNNTLTVISAIGNTGIGFQALEGLTTGAANTALGQSALTALQTGTHHVAIGLDALDSLLGGTDNVVVGDSSGTAYNTTESNNIILGANITGSVGEDNKMRLGNASTNQTYITGIFGNAPAAAQMAIVNASGQMGSQAIPSGTVSTLTGDTGGALSPTAGNFNIITNVAANNSGSSFSVAGSGSTLTINVTDGRANTLLGFGAGNASLTSNNNVGLGYGALHSLGVNGNSNTAVGFQAFTGLTTGFDSVAIGNQAGVSISTGVQNTLVGASAGLNLTTSASNNTLIGNQAGANYTSTESNNICLGQGVTGTLGESNKIRIGNASNNACFITGIDGVNVGSTAKVVTEGSNQLGTATITAGTNVSIGTSANTITINALGGGAVAWSVISANQTAAVNNGYFCNKAGTLALALPASSAVGDVIEVANINTATGTQFTQAAGQQIFVGNTSTTLGATGTLTSSAVGDTIKMVCRTANTTWQVVSMIGNWTPV